MKASLTYWIGALIFILFFAVIDAVIGFFVFIYFIIAFLVLVFLYWLINFLS
jgi:hypothetical protein